MEEGGPMKGRILSCAVVGMALLRREKLKHRRGNRLEKKSKTLNGSFLFLSHYPNITLIWINVRDPLYFLGYGTPHIYVKRILFSS